MGVLWMIAVVSYKRRGDKTYDGDVAFIGTGIDIRLELALERIRQVGAACA